MELFHLFNTLPRVFYQIPFFNVSKPMSGNKPDDVPIDNQKSRICFNLLLQTQFLMHITLF